MAALLGAHIIKVKLPSAHIEQKDAKKAYEGTDWAKQSDRVRHVVQSCFNGRRIVVFSGGAAFAEIAGCFSFWAWLRLGKTPLWTVPGIAALALFAWLLTLEIGRASGRERGCQYV